ncbi:MAG TPA: asparaginase [Hydrogenophaga sp.]|uniref:asparaginase n=1 Tax=Hydrogenophaga sp. TaxID=1904254 RepID=UPI002BD58854|nr:asparaginase [Hydrogenophaga sp.]HMN92356.1 asparaginase [Hydrogenophaga sp.]HMP10582.1 asparaginase [Hydrogenophaga sp.]
MPSLTIPDHTPMSVTVRGAHTENVHHGSIAVADSSGRLLAWAGDVDTPVFTRSALKPFQAMPLVHQGADRWALSDSEIALLCASHSGEPRHAEGVSALLARLGVGEDALACGVHTPYFYAATGRQPPAGETYSRLQHNCSGKHSGMLLLAQLSGEPLATYLHPDSAVQRAIVRSISHFSGVPADRLVRGIDGCSAPNYALPLRALATAIARLSVDDTDPVYANTPHRLARAMARHPEMVSGEGRNDLMLMRAGRGDWFSKVGADGVQVLGSFSRGVGVAAKCADGQLVPLMVGLLSALEQLGWLDDEARTALRPLLPPPLRNVAGIEVGHMQAAWRLKMAN